jgi:outer membrane protein assembly factor BamB
LVQVVLVAVAGLVLFAKPVPAQPQAAKITPEQTAAKQLSYRDLDLERACLHLIGEADRAVAAGLPNDALRPLQTILELPEDTFVWNAVEGRLHSARRLAHRRFASLPRETLRAYDRTYGPQARALLSRARGNDAVVVLETIMRRYFHTSAAFAALDQLGSRRLDRGEFGAAADCWMRLLDSPIHRNRFSNQQLLKVAWVFRVSGHHREADKLTRQLGEKRLVVGGRLTTARNWLSQQTALRTPTGNRNDVPIVFGNARRNHTTAGSTPHLQPIWQASLARQADPILDRLFETWKRTRESTRGPVTTANFAIVTGGKVVVRDFSGIRAFALAGGREMWRYRSESSLAATTEVIKRHFARNPGIESQLGNMIDIRRAYAGNATLGMISTDGHRVFAIDSMSLLTTRAAAHPTLNPFRGEPDHEPIDRASNRLIALPLDVEPGKNADQRAPLWRVGGPRGGDEPTGSLAGHFFLGAPLPVDGRLYAITEHNRQLNVVALDAASGSLLWSQGIALVARSITADEIRYFRSCNPAYADGVIVCPTQSGILVAVDALTGSLLWTYYCGDHTVANRIAQRSLARFRSHGSDGFPAVPRIEGNRVVFLPRLSGELHCVDLRTGVRLWKVPRHDGEYVGAMTSQGKVLVVGRRTSCGLSLETGKRVWSVTTGFPSGQGVRVGEQYLVPLQSGAVATIDLATGRRVGLSTSTSHRLPTIPLGNLLASGDAIVSTSARQVRVFPQASPLLTKVGRDVGPGQPSPAQRLSMAELELALGRYNAAKPRLESLLVGVSDTALTKRAENLLRGLLESELATGGVNAIGNLERLVGLVRTREDRVRYLMYKVETHLRDDDPRGVLAAVDELTSLKLSAPLPSISDPTLLMSPERWARGVVERLANRAALVAGDALTREIASRGHAALRSPDIHHLEQFLALHLRASQANAVRTELARRNMARGRFQYAELLLLQVRKSTNERTAAEGTRLLVDLWDKTGAAQEGGRLLAELADRFGAVELANGQTGREFVKQFPRLAPTWTAYRQWNASQSPAFRVQISEVRDDVTDASLHDTFKKFRRWFILPDDSSFQLLDKGIGTEGSLAIIDRLSGANLGRVAIPGQRSYPSLSKQAHVGHFIPIGATTEMLGLSLLEHDTGKPLWKTVPQQMDGLRDVMRVGPAGATFASFQSQDHLAVVDPATGRLLWQRTDLERGSGLISDSFRGLVGDERVLLMFRSDRKSYTVYRTETGEEVRQGTLEPPMAVFGRRLFYVSGEQQRRRAKLWDALDGSLLYDHPAVTSVPIAYTQQQELAILHSDRLHIIDVPTGRIVVDYPVEPGQVDPSDGLQMASDRDNFYINFQQPRRPVQARTYETYSGDGFVPATHMQGDLLVFQRTTGRLLWKKQLTQRSVLRLPHYHLPFLVTLARVRDRTNASRQSLLVELIDKQTGETIAIRKNLFPARILQTAYDPERQQLDLIALRSRVRIHFPPVSRGR